MITSAALDYFSKVKFTNPLNVDHHVAVRCVVVSENWNDHNRWSDTVAWGSDTRDVVMPAPGFMTAAGDAVMCQYISAEIRVDKGLASGA